MADAERQDRDALDAFVADLRSLYGASLRAVLLTGEAASAAYRPGRSPLSCAVLLEQVSAEALRRAQPRVRAWARRRIPTPLFLDAAYIASALDVFPLEFLALSDHHRLLEGDVDPFADLAIDAGHLRLQVEEQLRGKLLHLWEAYLETAGRRRDLQTLLEETPAGFEVVLRGILRLRQQAAGAEAEARPDGAGLLLAVERELGVALPTLRRLEASRREEARLAADELDGLFDAYLGEVRSLVRCIDAL